MIMIKIMHTMTNILTNKMINKSLTLAKSKQLQFSTN